MVFRIVLIWIKAHRLVTTVLVLILAFGIFVLIDGGGLHSPTSTSQKTTGNSATSTTTTASVSKSGILICLARPQMGKAPAQCTLTLKADDGNYYMLVDADSKSPKINTADLNNRIQVSGTLTSSKSGDTTKSAGTITLQSYGQIQ